MMPFCSTLSCIINVDLYHVIYIYKYCVLFFAFFESMLLELHNLANG